MSIYGIIELLMRVLINRQASWQYSMGKYVSAKKTMISDMSSLENECWLVPYFLLIIISNSFDSKPLSIRHVFMNKVIITDFLIPRLIYVFSPYFWCTKSSPFKYVRLFKQFSISASCEDEAYLSSSDTLLNSYLMS